MQDLGFTQRKSRGLGLAAWAGVGRGWNFPSPVLSPSLASPSRLCRGASPPLTQSGLVPPPAHGFPGSIQVQWGGGGLGLAPQVWDGLPAPFSGGLPEPWASQSPYHSGPPFPSL